ncbi:UNVERIFIED_CONTAM: hypothetical protein RKD50_000015 [Streptomyces canus]
MDLLTFPALAGPVLIEAVRFLFDRTGAVLDRRAGRTPLEEPEEVLGHPEPLRVRPQELTDDRVDRLSQAHGALQVYLSRPDFLQGDDADLRELLGMLRRDLEEIYGRGLPFGLEEQRPNPGVNVAQRATFVQNRQVGVRAGRIAGGAGVRVEQDAGVIGESGEQVGIEVEGTIG